MGEADGRRAASSVASVASATAARFSSSAMATNERRDCECRRGVRRGKALAGLEDCRNGVNTSMTKGLILERRRYSDGERGDSSYGMSSDALCDEMRTRGQMALMEDED